MNQSSQPAQVGSNDSVRPGSEASDYAEWQSVVFTLMGHAAGLYGEGKHDMPAWFYGLAEKIARAHVDEAHAQRVRAVAVLQSATYGVGA